MAVTLKINGELIKIYNIYGPPQRDDNDCFWTKYIKIKIKKKMKM